MTVNAHAAVPTHILPADAAGWLKLLAPRWKAIGVLVGTLALGATAISLPGNLGHWLTLALGSPILAGIVHQIPNFSITTVIDEVEHVVHPDGSVTVPVAAVVQQTVDAVVDAVPPGVANTVAKAVTDTTTGVLANATAAVTAVATPPTSAPAGTGGPSTGTAGADPVVGDDGSGGA